MTYCIGVMLDKGNRVDEEDPYLRHLRQEWRDGVRPVFRDLPELSW